MLLSLIFVWALFTGHPWVAFALFLHWADDHL